MPLPPNPCVVIVGASSGIGRATAHRFARRGARLTLAARRADELAAVVAECEAAGGEAHAVPTDVADAAQVDALARAAIDRHGAVDVWISNAAVGVVGRFHEAPMDDHRRTIETDLIGPMNGAHAILPHFVARGRGVIVNTVSVGGYVAVPFAAAYSAAKFGLRGLTEALRQELVDHPGIQVCGVYPGMVDTPAIDRAANRTGHRLRPEGMPMTGADAVAAVIVDVADNPRREAMVGILPWLARFGNALAPGLVERMVPRVMGSAIARAPAAPSTPGNLHRSPPQGPRTVGGGLRPSGPAPLAWYAPLAIAGLAAAGLAAAAVLRRA